MPHAGTSRSRSSSSASSRSLPPWVCSRPDVGCRSIGEGGCAMTRPAQRDRHKPFQQRRVLAMPEMTNADQRILALLRQYGWEAGYKKLEVALSGDGRGNDADEG